LGGLDRQRRAGASHGIGYVLGAVFDIPHGHTSCIMLPAVTRWNKPANAERRALIAAAMGHPGEDASDVLAAFIAGLAIPRSLAAVQIGPENFARIAQQAMATLWVPQSAVDYQPVAGARDSRIGGLNAALATRPCSAQ
jgi:maleylacetate reductase